MSHSSKPSVSAVHRRLDSIQRGEQRRSRSGSSVRQLNVSHDDACSYALRVAYLHYLLQPKQKRKQFVPAPKQPTRAYTSSVGDLVKELMPGNSGSVKLPHGFRSPLEKRMTGVLVGHERLPGYGDAALKRTFAEAYTAFTEQSFRKSIDKERKMEPLVLIFYSAATRACRAAAATDKPGDDSWKFLVDRHVAMFVRLVSYILRDMGSDRDKPELMTRLKTLENKLLTNDQNLFVDTGQAGGTTIEVTVPHSHDVKDMPLVQVVARIFGLSHSDVQNQIDTQRPNWTEEAALKDLKSYQHRLNSGMSGTLQSQDFETDEAYQDWKRAEAPHLSSMMMEILSANPKLARTSTYMASEKPLPASPSSSHAEDPSSEFSKALSSPESRYSLGDTFSLASLNLDDSSSIRSVDEAHYTFIPTDARSFFKTIAKYAMEFDAMHGDDGDQVGPLSQQSMELLTELSIHWRIPQFTRLVVFLEVAAGRFLDSQFTVIDVDNAFELVKMTSPETKKSPYIYLYNESLATIDRSRWTTHDLAIYQQTLNSIHDALLRELFDTLMHCYEPKPPSAGPALHVLDNHIYADPSFTRTAADVERFTSMLQEGLQKEAAGVYRKYLEDAVPPNAEDWDFNHVVELGKSVVKLCERIKKRYRSKPEIMGVNPLTILVETMFPSFEKDAEEIILGIIQVAQNQGIEFGSEDGFVLYKELVEIRKIHHSSLPTQPFAFDIEELLVSFVWRWIENAEQLTDQIVTNAINQDKFTVRSQGEGHITLDSERHSFSVIDMFKSFNQTTDQIFQLEWDNDVHHARFMTALSRIFANGIAKYCEVVGKAFLDEMSKPRPEDEAATEAAQTTQGKFMKYAKDAWTAKEKIEPFQFYTEVRRHWDLACNSGAR